MPAQNFINFLAHQTPLSHGFKAALISVLKEEHYQARQIIHSAGQIENRMWFLEDGFARSYYFDRFGKEHTFIFHNANELIFSFKGYWKEPSNHYLEILHPSSMLSVAYDELINLSLFTETKALKQQFVKEKLEQELFTSRLMSQTAKERYKQFRKAFPVIFRQASVRLIASYLNMTRENLSRLIGRDN